jgi:hypothetical protein
MEDLVASITETVSDRCLVTSEDADIWGIDLDCLYSKPEI